MHINYWRQSGQKNLEAAEILFRNKHYDGCLFFAHLALEKLLKGLVMRATKKAAPHTHDLPELATMAKLIVPNEYLNHLKVFTTFNIAGRYTKEKNDFYKKCTKPYTYKWLSAAKELSLWLKKQYQKS